jgi:DMSO/TMAO reductase YedYZ molybdopterin-dependent catalytic subunit
MTIEKPNRRRLLGGAFASAGSLLLSACDQSPGTVDTSNLLNFGEEINRRVQRLLLSRGALAPEYSEAELSPIFKANGTENPPDKDYQTLARTGFADWRLTVDGLVDNPVRLSLSDLRALPSRTQITRHDCVEGWSCIGKWTGVPLATILQRTGLKKQARFVVFHCADSMGGESALEESPSEAGSPNADATSDSTKHAQAPEGDATKDNSKSNEPAAKAADDAAQSDEAAESSGPKYYESLDLVDAFHPQTILAYEMNNAALTIPHGAPLRLRVERQLGYKQAKYIMRIEAVASFEDIGDGHGGYWEDQGYDWYAGI